MSDSFTLNIDDADAKWLADQKETYGLAKGVLVRWGIKILREAVEAGTVSLAPYGSPKSTNPSDEPSHELQPEPVA